VKLKKAVSGLAIYDNESIPHASTMNFNDICVLQLSSHTCEQNTLP